MRTLAITQNMSADGSIEFLGDWFDPTDQSEDLAAEVRRQSDTEEFMLLGRQTFTDFAVSGRSRPTTPPASPTT